MRELLLVVAAALVPGLALAEGAPVAPAPEVKQTVEAFAGDWTFEGTLTGVPGNTGPVKLKESFKCKKVGGGRVVSCHGKAVLEGVGKAKVEDEALLTYDEEGKTIRFVGMSSLGEVHDHKCIWKDDKTMVCDPLAITAGGQPATVDFSATWPDGKTMTMTESTTLKDGSKVVFDGKGKRK